MAHTYPPETAGNPESTTGPGADLATDTTPADNRQLFGIIAALEAMQQTAAERGVTVHDLQQDVGADDHYYGQSDQGGQTYNL